MELIDVVNKLWKEPGKELLIIYNPKGHKLFKSSSFDNLLKFLNLNLKKEELYYHPVTILASLLSISNVFRYDEKINSIGSNKISYKIEKVLLNKYQRIFVKKEGINIGLNLPEIVTPDNINNIIHSDINFIRPPQLRRILRDYFKCIKIDINMTELERKLLELEINSPEYSYLDADELFMSDKKYYENTYMELIPIELKEIIYNYIDQDEYVNIQNLRGKISNNLPNLIKGIVTKVSDKVNNGEDMSMMDIISSLDINNIGKELKDMGLNSIKDLLETIEEDYGMGNILSEINSKD